MWLERLARDGIGQRPRGRVGYDCMHAGLTQWVYRDRVSGEVVGEDALEAEYGQRCNIPWERYEMVGEMLTPAGREALGELKPLLPQRLSRTTVGGRIVGIYSALRS